MFTSLDFTSQVPILAPATNSGNEQGILSEATFVLLKQASEFDERSCPHSTCVVRDEIGFAASRTWKTDGTCRQNMHGYRWSEANPIGVDPPDSLKR
jgi:hypothetical protein